MEYSPDKTDTLFAVSGSATTPHREWQRTTRWLHGFIAVGISSQLLPSLVMANPHRLQQASFLTASVAVP